MHTLIKFTLVAVGMLFIGVMASLLLTVSSSSQIESMSHVSHVDWLPASASDITYARRKGFGWFFIYECTVPESDFRSLAQKEGWEIQEGTNVPVGRVRTILMLPDLTNVFGDPASSIDRALLFERRKPNGGGTTVVYDLERGRLFFSQSYR
jgi:hypothetical protein